MNMNYKTAIAASIVIVLVLYLSIYYNKVNQPEEQYGFDLAPFHVYDRSVNFLPAIECGDGWQQKYADLHRRTLNGENGGRVLVSIAIEGGIADNLSGLMSEFWLALLSERALQVYEYGYLPKYEPAFDYAYFNWSNPGIYPDILTDNLKYTYHGERGWTGDRSYPKEVNTTENWFIYQMNDHFGEKDEMFMRSNLHNQIPKDHTNATKVFMVSNRGMTYLLGHENNHHKEEFKQMGVRPEYMFGCAFRALFRPTEALLKRSEPWLRILKKPEVLKIGVMIRHGDGAFGEDRISNEKFKEYEDTYFKCAQEIENTRKKDDQEVIWFLLSDSLDLRRRAKIRFGKKVLTDAETNYIHPDCAAHDKERCSTDLVELAMMQAASQVITFAWTDYQVITRNSGFGRVGAVLGAGTDHIYSLPRDNPCNISHTDPWHSIATDWAGI